MGFEFDRVKRESGVTAMNATESEVNKNRERELTSEVLILPDGQVLAHNLTATFAALLSELNPHEEGIRRREKPVQETNP
jgi:hypothetical protein